MWFVRREKNIKDQVDVNFDPYVPQDQIDFCGGYEEKK